MDKFDHKILQELQRNARQSISAIAESVSLSRSAVSERIKRMEDNGDILGYQVICKPQHSNVVKAYFEIRHGGYHCENIARQALQIEGIQVCHGISGELDLILYAEAESLHALHIIREKLDNIPNAGSITTHIVMGEWKAS
ncbi:Lrp/AsnC family transcriptional regulator [Leucothrix sargassi]|nr:Lrp/AsnC family transcriptional regulator [Leucothrix sargassi]